MKALLGACLGLAILGCETPEPTDADPNAPASSATPKDRAAAPDEMAPAPGDPAAASEPREVGLTEGDEVSLRPAPEAIEPGRPWRRMNIDQLDAALQLASGGIAWTETDRFAAFLSLAAGCCTSSEASCSENAAPGHGSASSTD